MLGMWMESTCADVQSTFPTAVVALQEDIRILFRILEQLAITDSDTKTRIVMDLVRAYLSIKAFKNPGQMLLDKLDALAEKVRERANVELIPDAELQGHL
jgi:hypothetical protein